jgi:hypothetical protein
MPVAPQARRQKEKGPSRVLSHFCREEVLSRSSSQLSSFAFLIMVAVIIMVIIVVPIAIEPIDCRLFGPSHGVPCLLTGRAV